MTTMSEDALLPDFDTLAEAALLLVEEAENARALAEACAADVAFVTDMLDSAIASGASRLEVEELLQDLDRMRAQVRQQRQGAEMWRAVCDRCTLRMNVVLANPQWRN